MMAGATVDWLPVVFLLAALVLPVAALQHRRVPARKLVLMALAWAGILLVAILLAQALG